MAEVGRIGFLGAGKMATALARGWIQAGLVKAENVSASDPVAAARQAFQKETGASCGESSKAVAGNSDILILAVKPLNMAALLNEVAGGISTKHLVISIAAG